MHVCIHMCSTYKDAIVAYFSILCIVQYYLYVIFGALNIFPPFFILFVCIVLSPQTKITNCREQIPCVCQHTCQ